MTSVSVAVLDSYSQLDYNLLPIGVYGVDGTGIGAALGLRIRGAQPDEVEMVGTLLGEVYDAYRPHFPAEVWVDYIREIVDIRSRLADSELIVARIDGRLAGAVTFYPNASRSSLERWPEGWASIRTLAVIGGARRKGVGEALGRECIRRVQERQTLAIGLHTASFMAAANRLYRRLGFKRAPDLDIEIAEMFTGHSLPRELSWQAEAYELQLGGDLR